MAAPPPALMEELVEEVLLRFPPDDPASLVRAALVCKQWCRLVSGRGFRRQFRERHRTPPVLGFLASAPTSEHPVSLFSRFVPTTSFRPPRADLDGWLCLHSGHGRVLFWGPHVKRLLVWDPMTDERRELPRPQWWCSYPSSLNWNAAVLCAASVGGACNHLDCHGGPFLVVFVGGIPDHGTATSVYSSKADAWSEMASTPELHHHWCWTSKALSRNALYFNNRAIPQLLRYEFTTSEVSVIHLPAEAYQKQILVMALEDDRMGFAYVQESKLYLWCSESGSDGDRRWAQSRVIELDTLLPVASLSAKPWLAGCADDARVIVLWTSAGFFAADTKSGWIKEASGAREFFNFVPFMSFCTPALRMASTCEGSRVHDSTA